MTKILLVSAESLAEGYAPEAFMRGLGGSLKELGHDVEVCALDTGPYHRSTMPIRLWRYAVVAKRVMARFRWCDVIVSRGHFAHLPWALAAAALGKPVIHIMNGFVNDAATTHRMGPLTRKLADLSYRAQFRMASRTVAVTEEIASNISARFRTNGVVVIANGVNVAFFQPLPHKTTAAPYAIFPSSLAPWHDAETIFHAIEQPAWPANLEAVIVGDGANSDYVRKRSEASGRVRFLGLQSPERLRKLMQEARIGLCLVTRQDVRSVNEVLPLKLFEMMACGLPVIVTDLAGQRDIVAASGAGLIVPERDAAALAAAVRDLHLKSDLAEIGQKGADYVVAHKSWTISAQRLADLMSDAIGNRRAAA